eukprot:scaffold282805_cov27-Tisochrysis_lutea.AAC.1
MGSHGAARWGAKRQIVGPAEGERGSRAHSAERERRGRGRGRERRGGKAGRPLVAPKGGRERK